MPTPFIQWVDREKKTPRTPSLRVLTAPVPLFQGARMAPVAPDKLDPTLQPTSQRGDVTISAPGPSPNHDAGCICVYCAPPSIQRIDCSYHGRIGLAYNTPRHAERVSREHVRRAHHGNGHVLAHDAAVNAREAR